MVEERKGGAPKSIEELFTLLDKAKELELEDVDIVAEELALEIVPSIVQAAPPPAVAPPAVAPPTEELVKAVFKPPVGKYAAKIAVVQIGATGSEGGTRKKVIKIGGETVPPFYHFEGVLPHRPVIALDVFDSPPPLPKTIKSYYKDVFKDHVAWVRKCIDEFEADLVTLHLTSTDPSAENRPADEAARFVDKVLDQVEIPVIVGGSGNPDKDMLVFEEVAKVTEGERLVLASVTVDMDVEKAVKAIAKHGHNVIALAFLDINQVKELNRKLLSGGLPKDHLITDPSTGGLGYGIEYTFSIMERMRMAGLMGEETMQVPISCAATNAWVAREAWMPADEWGPREYRGPLWEITTGLVNMLAGADLFMMMHPVAAKTLKRLAEALSKPKAEKLVKEAVYDKWVTMKA
ncbi:MAG: CO dehydrogenase/acetyl-CoA synthase subunit delta [Candidatus Nezhaarchaeales archaeon]